MYFVRSYLLLAMTLSNITLTNNNNNNNHDDDDDNDDGGGEKLPMPLKGRKLHFQLLCKWF